MIPLEKKEKEKECCKKCNIYIIIFLLRMLLNRMMNNSSLELKLGSNLKIFFQDLGLLIVKK